MKQIICSFFFLIFALAVQSQNRYCSPLSEVPAGGFYRIEIPLSVRSRAQTHLADLRILSQAGEQVPYLVRSPHQLSGRQEYLPCPTRRLHPDKPGTCILIETGQDTLSSLVLNLKNADTWKKANLQGSWNAREWFSVKNDILLADNFNHKTTSVLQIINFPPSNYSYYLLTIDDSLSAPLHILEVGKIHTLPRYPYRQMRLPATTHFYSCQDTTVIGLKYDASYPVSALQLYASSPPIFQREALLLNRSGYVMESFILSSGQPASLHLPCQLRTDSLTLLILNGNLPPLQIDSLNSYIRELFLVACFPTCGKYELTYGDPIARAPHYDHHFFGDQIPGDLPPLKILSSEPESLFSGPEPQAWRILLQRYGLWALFLVIAIQLFQIVRKIIREEKKNKRP